VRKRSMGEVGENKTRRRLGQKKLCLSENCNDIDEDRGKSLPMVEGQLNMCECVCGRTVTMGIWGNSAVKEKR
jgi:hypothetical protein